MASKCRTLSIFVGELYGFRMFCVLLLLPFLRELYWQMDTFQISCNNKNDVLFYYGPGKTNDIGNIFCFLKSGFTAKEGRTLARTLNSHYVVETAVTVNSNLWKDCSEQTQACPPVCRRPDSVFPADLKKRTVVFGSLKKQASLSWWCKAVAGAAVAIHSRISVCSALCCLMNAMTLILTRF